MKAHVPKTFPQSPEMKKILRKLESVEARGSAMEVIRANIRAILYDLACGLSANDIAIKYQVSRRSLFNYLAKAGVSISEIQEAARKEEEFKRLTKLEQLQKKIERRKLLPSDLDSFARIPVIEKIIMDLRREGVTDKVIARYVRVWHDLCMVVGKHPEDLTADDLRRYYDEVLERLRKEGKDLRSYDTQLWLSSEVKTPLRVLCKNLGLPIESYLRTVEYQGKYATVRIGVKHRYKILKAAKEMYPKLYEMIRAVLFYLYRTGSRRSALMKCEFEVQDNLVLVRTKEKGKRYQIEWVKVIPHEEYENYIKGYIPMSEREVKEVIKALRDIYKVALADIKDTLTYKYAMKKPLHIWRHTSCLDLLEATDWNIALVAKTLGWRNPAMINKVYGDMPFDYVLSALGFIKREKAEWKFLYNEWEEKARAEGLI